MPRQAACLRQVALMGTSLPNCCWELVSPHMWATMTCEYGGLRAKTRRSKQYGSAEAAMSTSDRHFLWYGAPFRPPRDSHPLVRRFHRAKAPGGGPPASPDLSRIGRRRDPEARSEVCRRPILNTHFGGVHPCRQNRSR